MTTGRINQIAIGQSPRGTRRPGLRAFKLADSEPLETREAVADSFTLRADAPSRKALRARACTLFTRRAALPSHRRMQTTTTEGQRPKQFADRRPLRARSHRTVQNAYRDFACVRPTARGLYNSARCANTPGGVLASHGQNCSALRGSTDSERIFQ